MKDLKILFSAALIPIRNTKTLNNDNVLLNIF